MKPSKYKVMKKRMRCTSCGNEIVIFRKTTSNRKKGHLKFLYCYICKRDVNHREMN